MKNEKKTITKLEYITHQEKKKKKEKITSNELNVAPGNSELVKKLGLCVAVGLGECVIKLRNL